MSNLEIWDKLKTTDPAHTKKFDRGTFKGTSVKPIYMVHKMTEVFGPAGKGWGMGEPGFKVVECGENVMVYCTVALWHGERENVVYGVGGDFAARKTQNGVRADDEAFKKAYTDAMSNAMKQIGMAADVHMGQHDDDKYLTAVKEDLAKTVKGMTWTGPLTKTKLVEELRRVYRDLRDCTDLDQFDACYAHNEAVINQARIDMPTEWEGPVEDGKPYKEAFMELRDRIVNPMAVG